MLVIQLPLEVVHFLRLLPFSPVWRTWWIVNFFVVFVLWRYPLFSTDLTILPTITHWQVFFVGFLQKMSDSL
jgi:hypothetical protein